MDEVTSAKAYRERQRKIVTLPSGFVFEIKKMSPLTFTKMFELIGVGTDVTGERAEEMVKEKLYDVLKLIIPECVVNPKIVLESTDDEDALALEDLEMDDFFALLNEISEFSGLGEESIKDRDRFRKK